jgi:serine/threonine-protein kinase
MPDLIGLAKDDAEQIVNSLGLGISEIIYDYSTEQPSGKIFAQNPIATSTVNKLTSITIYISMGENPEGTIPDVIGMTEQVAFDALNNDGFKNITVITEESKSEIDKVFAQIPESGTTYTKISEVIIKISKGIMVPDVVGMKKNDAVTILEDLGFTVTIIPDLPANNNVTSQIPAANSYINFGETVAIEIEDTGTTETTETTGTTDSTDPTETTETTPETTDP